MAFFSGRRTETVIIGTIFVTTLSFGLFIYQQNITEDNVRNSLFLQYKDRQMETTELMSRSISSDLESVLFILQGLASSAYLQEDELQSDRADRLIRERFDEITEITKVDRLLITNDNDTVVYDLHEEGQRSFVNMDLSSRDSIQETRNTSRPTLSDGFQGVDGIFRISLSVPIISQDDGRYIGTLAVEVPNAEFFARYGNVYDIESEYLAVLDLKSVQLIHPVNSFIGLPFFGNYTQEATGNNKILNNLIQTVMAGTPSSATYEFRNAERLNTGYPIVIAGRPEYFSFVITPTAQIYTQVNEVLLAERSKTYSLVAGAIVAIVVLMVLLIKWNSMLNTQVERKTRELKESNEELKIRDNLQKDFINTAAHELRTPIQPILGLSEVLSKQLKDRGQLQAIHIISRNARRLQRLAEDILDASRLEASSFTLKKEILNINDLIQAVVEDFRDQIVTEKNGNKEVRISFDPMEDVILVKGDRARLRQVISNLIDNSIKFTSSIGGEISIVSERNQDRVIVSVEDTGTGVPKEMLPHLFKRFVSKSFSGTGLGLYLSKRIIEAHGGEISGQNNSNGVGAKFWFSLSALKL